MISKSANNYPTVCTDGEVKKLWDSVNNPHEKPERQKLVRRVIERLRAAESVCDEAVNVAYNTATTVGTKTNEGMPRWFLARVKDLDKALTNWWKVSGKSE